MESTVEADEISVSAAQLVVSFVFALAQVQVLGGRGMQRDGPTTNVREAENTTAGRPGGTSLSCTRSRYNSSDCLLCSLIGVDLKPAHHMF